MQERLIDIPAPGGRMETFVTHPEEGGPFPAVVIYMDVWGVREELFEIARRIATVGYYCMVPDLYYRQGRIRHEFRDGGNRMISLAKLDDEKKQRVLAPLAKLTDAMVVDDTGALVRFVDQGEPVRRGPMGAIGYCMGGRHVFRVAGHHADRFRACASLHGTDLVSDRDDSPHLLCERFRGELYCGFAEFDHYAPMSTIETLAKTLERCAVQYRHAIHAGAVHGYALPDRDIFHRQAAARDWEMIFAMFHRQIPPAFAR